MAIRLWLMVYTYFLKTYLRKLFKKLSLSLTVLKILANVGTLTALE